MIDSQNYDKHEGRSTPNFQIGIHYFVPKLISRQEV